MLESTSDEQKVILRWKVVIPAVISLLIVSNTFTLQISEIDENKRDIIRAEEANRRRLEHAMEKQDFKTTIKDLRIELKECQDAK